MFSNTIKIYSNMQFSPMKFNLLHVFALLSLVFVGSHAVRPLEYGNSVLPNTPMPTAIKDLLFKAWDDGMERVTSNTASTYIKSTDDEVALDGSHAVTPEVYWKSVLPNTPMPKSLKDLLYTEWNDEKNTEGVGIGGVQVHTGHKGNQLNDNPKKRVYVGVHKEPNLLLYHAASGNQLNDNPKKRVYVGVHKEPNLLLYHAASGNQLNDNPKKRVYVGVHKEPNLLLYHAASGNQLNNNPKKRVYVGVHEEPNLLLYHAASGNLLNDNPNVAVFFLQNDLHQGKEMNLHFTKNDDNTTFLPRIVADSIPFSSNKLPEIYNEFSVKPESMEAEIIKQTLNECETAAIEGEEKYCATSLESMVDFSTTKLGKNLKVISTEVVNSKKNTPLQTYKITIAQKLTANKVVVCHKQNYAYAVFYCHTTVSTEAYAVSMTGADGTKVNAVAVCHMDTAKWNPEHPAFQVLKVKPGTVPICHFMPEDQVVWVPY